MALSSYRTLDPSTGKLIQEFPVTTDGEVHAALENAHKAYIQDWRHRSVTERAKIMSRAANLMRERTDELARLATLEMGKQIDHGRAELDLSARILQYYADNAEEFLRSHPIEGSAGAVIATEPIGVIVAIEPWNFPYYQVARVAGPQIMAGNTLIVKHASSVPQCALAIAKLFEDAGAPLGVYTNIYATIPQINTLIEDIRVRGITLTGSERAGAAVAERAGRYLKKVVLELGGSDPFIVLEDAPLEAAIKEAAIGRMLTTGQSCAAVKRIIVVGKQRGHEFLEGLKEIFDGLLAGVGDPMEPSTSLGPVFSESGLNDLLQQVEAAREAGATVAFGGKRINRPGFYLEPTIVTDISKDNPLFMQETFGPVASFYVVDSEDEAIELANATNFGLGSSIFSSNITHAKEIARKIEAGMVFINSMIYSGPEVPFGGVKNSGFGRELSALGIHEFVNKKLIRVAGSK